MTGELKPLWDIPTRVFHWSLVLLLCTSWWTAENGEMVWHNRSGYAVLTLLIFRIVWGFVGSDTARFSQFVKNPRAVFSHLRNFNQSESKKSYWGHNPAGGWSVVLLILLMLTQVTLGLFAEDVDGNSGPLSHIVGYDANLLAAETHEILFDIILFFVVVHIVAVFFYLLFKKDNLIIPMLTGKKQIRADTNEESAVKIAPLWLAGILLVATVGFVWWLVT